MPIDYRNRARLIAENPALAQALDDLADHIEHVNTQTNVTPSDFTTPPPSIGGITVVAAQGIFDVAILDNNSPVARGINYFVEYSVSPQFNSPVVLDLGASRNWRGKLGNMTLYWRAYSSYDTSARSAPVYFGSVNNPVAVAGGGTDAGPQIQPSNGSGTSKGSSGSDGGFGNNQRR